MGTSPTKIAFLTFTKAARYEALIRTGKREEEFPYLKTIHSICYRQLTVGKDQIVRPESIRDFGKRIGVKVTGATHDPWIEEFERGVDAPTREDFLIQANHAGRHRGVMLKEALRGLPMEIDFKFATWFTRAYHDWKFANGLLDYTDLLTRYVEYGKPLDIDTIFIDEAQDLSDLQWKAVFRLGENAKKWFICGDDDQAIFHWAGADSHIFQDLKADETKVLNQSYRVSKAVHKAAMRIANRISKRMEKEYSPTESEGLVADAGYLGTMNFKHKTFVLFRNHYRGGQFAQFFRSEYIPFIGKGSIVQSVDVRSALYAYSQLTKFGEVESIHAKALIRYANEDYIDGMASTLVKQKAKVKIQEVFIQEPRLHDWFRILSHLPNIDTIGPYIHKNGIAAMASPRIELLSIHQSKGREAHTVVMDPEMSKATWLGMTSNPDDEHRVQYVGITRAKERVYFLLPDGNYSYKY